MPGPAPTSDGSGKVTIADILYVVSRYGTSDPLADLSGDGRVTVNDILIAISEYRVSCRR